MTATSTQRVPQALDGARADRACTELFELSRAAVRRLLDAKRVRIGGRALKKGDVVAAGDLLELRGGGAWFAETSLRLPELYCDAHVLIVDKPAGMPAHPLVPGEGDTAADAAISAHPELATASEDAREGGVVHRLDTGTSGALAFARDRETWRAMRTAFARAEVEKHYLALVHGRIDGALDLTAPLAHDSSDPRRMRLARGDDDPQQARTRVVPLATSGATTWVEVQADGGRRHQVRVHLASAGHPLVGDVLYGAEAAVDMPWHALHASLLVLPGLLPVSCPPPDAFVKAAAARGLRLSDAPDERSR